MNASATLATALPAGLKRLTMAAFPTPLEAAHRLGEALGLGLYVKREDCSGYGLGGNKLRKLDFIMADVLAKGHDAVITTAGAQSNFCRALAAASAKLGLACGLLLRGSGADAVQGNLLLDQVFGATVRFTDVTDPWDPRVKTELTALAEVLRAQGRNPAVVHLPGATASLAAAAWVTGAEELDAQWRAAGIDPAALYVAVGSGLTMAGLALGLKRAGRRCRVVGISVQQPRERIVPWIVETAAGAARLAGIETVLTAGDFDLDDSHRGPAYGVPSDASLEALAMAGRHEGLILDPVYTGKAMAGLIAHARAGAIARGETVAFLHSGGTPGLFVHSDLVARSMT
ncbi:MAG: pyridoxal-phosphate dependent enzyme [Alphaproteobacteria bacterium]|nr:pyridoxal-phosphate dependent enzyme [Alphaproteobacteria bacterium]